MDLFRLQKRVQWGCRTRRKSRRIGRRLWFSAVGLTWEEHFGRLSRFQSRKNLLA